MKGAKRRNPVLKRAGNPPLLARISVYLQTPALCTHDRTCTKYCMKRNLRCFLVPLPAPWLTVLAVSNEYIPGTICTLFASKFGAWRLSQVAMCQSGKLQAIANHLRFPWLHICRRQPHACSLNRVLTFSLLEPVYGCFSCLMRSRQRQRRAHGRLRSLVMHGLSQARLVPEYLLYAVEGNSLCQLGLLCKICEPRMTSSI